MIISVKGHHNDLFRFDKKAVLPLRGILALLIVLHHIAEEIPPIAVFSQLTYWGNWLIQLLSISVLPIYIVFIMYRLRISESVILNYMGKISLHIYLAQGAVCAFVAQFGLNTSNPLMYMVLVITISIVTARVIYWLSNLKTHNI